MVENDCILIKPAESPVSEFCTKLTTLTQKDVDKGISFKEACRLLDDSYNTKDFLWASWGDYDRCMFEKQAARMGTDYPFGPTHLNLKSLFALAHGLPREVSVRKALEVLGLAFEGTSHRGVDDARNIARIYSRLVSGYRKGEETWKLKSLSNI